MFGTLIALLKEGVPILGVLDQPITKERWVGASGQQTTLNGMLSNHHSTWAIFKCCLLHCLTAGNSDDLYQTSWQRVRSYILMVRSCSVSRAAAADKIVQGHLWRIPVCDDAPHVQRRERGRLQPCQGQCAPPGLHSIMPCCRIASADDISLGCLLTWGERLWIFSPLSNGI